MMRRLVTICLFFGLPILSFSQIITYSEPIKDDTKDINFEIVGKVSGNLLVFKNIKSNYAITVYDNEMKTKETVQLDFLPDKTFNVNFIAYTNFIYLIYQYQKKGIVYCSAVKLDADAKLITQPVDLDTTYVGNRDNKIYTTINSEDKQKVLIFKTLKDRDQMTIASLLLDDQLQPIKRARQDFPYDERKYVYSNFSVDNDGGFVFTSSVKPSGRDYFNQLSLIDKPAMADIFTTNTIDLNGKFTEDVNVKIDNLNKHYILNSFFYTEKRGNAQGIFSDVWDKESNTAFSNLFIAFDDSVRMAVKKEKRTKEAFNGFIIKNVIAKKDGGYILMAEDYSIQQSNGNFNRWDNFYNSPFASPFGYNPFFYNPYSPYGFNNYQTTSYNYQNIFIVSIDKYGHPEWNTVIYKDQFDNNENALSFATFNTGGEIHLLYNELVKRKQVLTGNSITANGEIDKTSTINNLNPDYQFLPRFGKQVGGKQFIIPCIYRNQICFAKIEY